MVERKYEYNFSELIDRLTILGLKETFNPELKKEYAQEISDVIHDINIILTETNKREMINAEFIRNVIVLAQFNQHIWGNEDLDRKVEVETGEVNWEEKYKRLRLTHSLNNGIRNVAKKKIQSLLGGRYEFKNMGLAPEHDAWRPYGY